MKPSDMNQEPVPLVRSRLKMLSMTLAEAPAPAPVAQCACKDRPADKCPGQWEPGCDLGASEAHAKTAPAPVAPRGGSRIPSWAEKWMPRPTIPAARAPVAQQPLSRDAVKAILTEAGYDTVNVQGRCDFIAGLRHGESAHGITGNATAQEGGAA